MLCYAMLCDAMRMQGLGGAVASAFLAMDEFLYTNMNNRQLYQGSTWGDAPLCIAEDAFIAGQTEQLKGVQQNATKLDEERRTAVEHV